jgi:hypothetical protein
MLVVWDKVLTATSVAKAVTTPGAVRVAEEDTMVVDQVVSIATMDRVDQVVAEVVILRPV